MNLTVDLTLLGLIVIVFIWKTFSFKKEKKKDLIKSRRFFTKKNETGVYYEEDEKGNIKKHVH